MRRPILFLTLALPGSGATVAAGGCAAVPVGRPDGGTRSICWRRSRGGTRLLEIHEAMVLGG